MCELIHPSKLTAADIKRAQLYTDHVPNCSMWNFGKLLADSIGMFWEATEYRIQMNRIERMERPDEVPQKMETDFYGQAHAVPTRKPALITKFLFIAVRIFVVPIGKRYAGISEDATFRLGSKYLHESEGFDKFEDAYNAIYHHFINSQND